MVIGFEVLWQHVFQVVVCVLRAVQRVIHMGQEKKTVHIFLSNVFNIRFKNYHFIYI
jgi:hypothetical protein